MLKNTHGKSAASEGVLFSNESEINVYGSDGRTVVWRKPVEETSMTELVFIDTIKNSEDYCSVLDANHCLKNDSPRRK